MKRKQSNVLPGQLSIWDSPFYEMLMGGGVSSLENTDKEEVAENGKEICTSQNKYSDV